MDKSSNASKPPTTKMLHLGKSLEEKKQSMITSKQINGMKAATTHASPRINLPMERSEDDNSASDYAVLERTLTHHIVPETVM